MASDRTGARACLRVAFVAQRSPQGPWPLGAALITALALSLPSHASARERVALAPLFPLGISGREAKKVSRWIRVAMGAVAGFRVVGTRKLARLLRKRAHVDCSSRPPCVAGLVRKVGAGQAVVGDVGRVGGAYIVYLRLIGGKGKQIRAVSGLLDPKRKLRRSSQALAYRLLSPDRYTGRLDVKIGVKGAWIYLDGRRVARSPAGTIRGIAVGTHALRITHESYRDYVRFVRVEFKKVRALTVKLSPYAVHATRMRLDRGGRVLADHELPWYRRYWALITWGAVVAAATTVSFALIPRRVGRDADAIVGRP